MKRWIQLRNQMEKKSSSSVNDMYQFALLLKDLWNDSGFQQDHPTFAEREQAIAKCTRHLMGVTHSDLLLMIERFPKQSDWQAESLCNLRRKAQTALQQDTKRQPAIKGRASAKPLTVDPAGDRVAELQKEIKRLEAALKAAEARNTSLETALQATKQNFLDERRTTQRQRALIVRLQKENEALKAEMVPA